VPLRGPCRGIAPACWRSWDRCAQPHFLQPLKKERASSERGAVFFWMPGLPRLSKLVLRSCFMRIDAAALRLRPAALPCALHRSTYIPDEASLRHGRSRCYSSQPGLLSPRQTFPLPSAVTSSLKAGGFQGRLSYAHHGLTNLEHHSDCGSGHSRCRLLPSAAYSTDADRYRDTTCNH
jgi:hypothetical protein